MKINKLFNGVFMETQRIMVTGGSGFIGTNLVNELRSRGHEVLSVDLLHHEDEADLYSDSYSDYVRGDIRNYRQMERIFDENEKFDYVYNLAAEYGRWNGEGYYENLWETNVIGLKNMIRLQEKLGFRMISFSSAEVYGDYEGIMTEDVMENRPIKDTYQMKAVRNFYPNLSETEQHAFCWHISAKKTICRR